MRHEWKAPEFRVFSKIDVVEIVSIRWSAISNGRYWSHRRFLFRERATKKKDARTLLQRG
ncbi:MAG: hypothetical protein BGN99_06785 [Alphaproteobacteria bacterium 65-37]|jgi:hypothetical protein|nr:MAG: hypothetical protein BGN99_06785 [Alphaproteobacteria bacterium 65-37]